MEVDEDFALAQMHGAVVRKRSNISKRTITTLLRNDASPGETVRLNLGKAVRTAINHLADRIVPSEICAQRLTMVELASAHSS